MDGYPLRSAHPDCYILGGETIYTDSSGDVRNTASKATAPLDQHSLPMTFGKGIASVAKISTGRYRITLLEGWFKLLSVVARPIVQLNARVTGTVDLSTIVLSTLDGTTLKTDGDVGALFTTTFTTPTDIADIAVQINAGAGGTSVVAEILTGANGTSKYLSVYSSTTGAASTLAIDATSTGDDELGMSNTTATSPALGQFDVSAHNVKSGGIDFVSAKTIEIAHVITGGVVGAFNSSAFILEIRVSKSPLT